MSMPDMDIGGGMVLRGTDPCKKEYSVCSWKELGLTTEKISFIRNFHKMDVEDSWSYLDYILAMCGWDTWIGYDPDYIRLESIDKNVLDGIIYKKDWKKSSFSRVLPRK